MEKTVQLYEGKAKRVYATTDEDVVLVSYKDDATAFNGLKKGTILGKGVVNNVCSNFMFQLLEKKGIPTHYVKEINERETYVKKVEIVPLEVIIRNKAAGSFSKRYGVPEGTELATTVIEFSYKNDDLGDPLINDYHALALKLATKEEIEKIKTLAFKVNDFMKSYFAEIGVELIDFKLEFGRFKGDIILADEISPDTCRFWDAKTGEKLDKDRFRRDMDDVDKGYREMMKRMGISK
ncbi:MAG: phosphoribosylaminoimidazolesuccinocarboxamide synthase [Clostridia bacterium]|nr:phosphoribosylaminoimidazolesuccinocarboxamide synthase [Clostridia bacterium]MDE7328402.1 phosphoribosylaminoimidazolesuccinocarboxamide synthase [Clostridia bacterium]